MTSPSFSLGAQVAEEVRAHLLARHAIDLTDLPGSGLGSAVTLWGDGLNASEVASWADSIPYQLFCNLNRVPRHYRD